MSKQEIIEYRAEIDRTWSLLAASFPSLRREIQRIRRRSRR
jgi:hypothetical protein